MGIRKFILKPVDKDELAAAIRSALDSRPPL
jgi:DNA-binding NarL/FixJ family response regulator